VELVAQLLCNGDTEVSVLLPRIQHDRVWHKLLHDRTADAIASALSDMPHANVTLIPYHLGRGRRVSDPRRLGRRAVSSVLPVLPASVARPADAVPIGGLRHRQRVTVAGRVRALRVQPRSGVPTLQATLADDSGEIRVVFLGRRQIPGIEPGAYVAVTGIVGEHSGQLEILNPDYQLLAPIGT
jgi:RecG-like helicase